MIEICYLGFTFRVVSSEWAKLIGRDQLERMRLFLRRLQEIRELPEVV